MVYTLTDIQTEGQQTNTALEYAAHRPLTRYPREMYVEGGWRCDVIALRLSLPEHIWVILRQTGSH